MKPLPGPWTVIESGLGFVIESGDFTNDVQLVLSGDFGTRDDEREYADRVASCLNAASRQDCGGGK